MAPTVVVGLRRVGWALNLGVTAITGLVSSDGDLVEGFGVHEHVARLVLVKELVRSCLHLGLVEVIGFIKGAVDDVPGSHIPQVDLLGDPRPGVFLRDDTDAGPGYGALEVMSPDHGLNDNLLRLVHRWPFRRWSN